MILFVPESHCALRFGRPVDEDTQRVERKRMVVASGRHKLHLAVDTVILLGVYTRNDEPFDLGRGERRDALLLLEVGNERLEASAEVRIVRRAVAIEDRREEQHLAGTEHIGRHPADRREIDLKTQVRFVLRREASDRRAVEGEVLERVEEELLVVVEHVQSAFDVREADRHRFHFLLPLEPRDVFTLEHARRDARRAILGLPVHLFELLVWDLKKFF